MEASRAAVGAGRVLASIEEVWASAVGPWFSILSVQSVLCGLLAATLGGILFMKLGKKVRVSLGHLSSPIIGNWLQDQSKFKVNDHIYELYKPKGDIQPAMEILFFHGLQFGPSQHAYLSTWTSPGDGSTGEQVWPGTWLAEEFPNARILSMSYDSSMRTTPEQGRSDLFNVAENLINAICLANIGQEFRRPVILVGHSFGGLVIKKLCIEANHRIHSQRPDLKTNQMINEFLHNVGGVFFYGTPHHGSALGSMASRVLDGPLLAYVKRLSTVSARLHEDFCDVCINYKIWRVAGVGELLATRLGPFDLFPVVVVPEASARYGEFSTVQEDHISLCKPSAKTSNNFQLLTAFVRSIVPKEGAYFENMQRTPKAAVGLDLLVEDVQCKLQANSMLGMVGMGGIGKTTLAMVVFNNLGPQFEYSCFVPEVKLIARRVEETVMKKELWERMHCRGKMVANPNTGDWSQLRGKKLLLVLDDVAEDCDLNILSDIKEVVDSGSRFIVTSRNKVLLTSFEDDIHVYPVQGLTETNAKKLFMSYAFPKQAVLPVAFESLVDRIVEKCDGLPLTLQVLGNYLKSSKEDKIWEQTLQALDKADNVAGLDEKLWAKLRLSYTGLSREEQQMFLDVTTFFICSNDLELPWTLREAKAAWSVTYGYEDLRWRSLVDMSLVYDGNQDEPIKVHEQLRSLGRKIASDANQDGKCIRVWEIAEGLKLLQSTDRSSNQEFHSLRLKAPEVYQFTILESCFRRFKKLRYLDVDRDFGGDRGLLAKPLGPWNAAEENVTVSTDLVLLLAPNLHLDVALVPDLAVLKLSDYDLEYLPGSIGLLSALKILHIRADNLRTLPIEFGHLLRLEWLILDSERLQTLPETFGDLSNLKHLQFNNHLFQTLPNSFGRLSNLQYLAFYYCHNLQSLPESFEELSSLQDLYFRDCDDLHVLPESFGRLPALKQLKFYGRCALQCLPESFGQLSVLENLLFEGCPNLQSLPESFVQLPALNRLKFRFFNSLQCLPELFGQLPVLENLKFSSCPDLQSLPDSFVRLPALNRLEFNYCDSLQCLPESFGQLSVLEHLLFEECPNLQSLPESFGQLTRLRHLEFIGTSTLQSLPESFGQLSVLEHLEFDSCTSFHSLPETIGKLSSLRHLEVRDCDKLHTLPDCQFPNLEELTISDCRKIESLPFSPGQLKALHRLAIHYIALREIPDWIKSLPMLQILELGGLPYLEGWPRWLGVIPLDLAATTRKFSRTLEGQFSSDELENEGTDGDKLQEWLYADVMNKMMALDYDGAIADLQRALRVLDPVEWLRRRFILQERGIAKRYAGHLDGALEDLTLALTLKRRIYDSDDGGDGGDSDDGEDGGDSDDGEDGGDSDAWGIDGESYSGDGDMYNCRRHRGYVKYLSGDVEGAREDGKEALKHFQKITMTVIRFGVESNFGYKSSLGDESVSYLEFKFMGLTEMGELLQSPLRAKEKVHASDFHGALAEFELIEATFPGFELREPFFLQERGICKRLVGDLDGALEDLTLALALKRRNYDSDDGGDGGDSDDGEDGGDSDDWGIDGESYSEDGDMYNCRRHRGYVKYLSGDVEGAREDGKEALKHLQKITMTVIRFGDESNLGYKSSLGDESVSYLEFKFMGLTEMGELLKSPLQAKEKVQASDFHGALAEFEPIEATFPELREPFFLQERGICKRLVGDLDGALKDLTVALEVGWEEKHDDYECRKHRGFVKYLLGDLDGAREDANQAIVIGCRSEYRNNKWSDEWEIGHRSCLGVDPAKFLEFKLK